MIWLINPDTPLDHREAAHTFGDHFVFGFSDKPGGLAFAIRFSFASNRSLSSSHSSARAVSISSHHLSIQSKQVRPIVGMHLIDAQHERGS